MSKDYKSRVFENRFIRKSTPATFYSKLDANCRGSTKRRTSGTSTERRSDFITTLKELYKTEKRNTSPPTPWKNKLQYQSLEAWPHNFNPYPYARAKRRFVERRRNGQAPQESRSHTTTLAKKPGLQSLSRGQHSYTHRSSAGEMVDIFLEWIDPCGSTLWSHSRPGCAMSAERKPLSFMPYDA